MMSLTKSFFKLTDYMKNDPEYGVFWNIIHDEYCLTKDLILRLTGFKILMEESPYGQLKQVKIKQSIRKSNMRIINEWYTSLIAFPLTGDYGRKPIIPDNRSLFKLLIFLEKIFSFVLNKFIFFAKISHFKVNFIIKKN